MKFEVVDSLAYQRRDRLRVARNNEALRVARIDAKDAAKEAGVPFDATAWEETFTPPEEEPEGVFMAGGSRFVIVTRERGDPPYTEEQMAQLVRERMGQYKDSDPAAGAVNHV